MSSNEPQGPPPPPSSEILEGGRGDRLPRSGGSGGRRRAFLVAAAALGVVGAGAAAWGAWWYFSTGDQPAEALPADTLGYVALDLDPSGSQKIDALRTLQKFPAIERELDLGGDVTDIDVKRKVFESIAEEADCDLDYAADFEPWLGDRYAVAAVDLGADEPDVVGVVHVTDGEAARDAVAKLDACDGAEEATGTALSGDWLLLAEDDKTAEDVAAATEDGSLADDKTFQDRMGEAGDPGILTMYAGPAAGDFFRDLAEDETGGDLPDDVPEDALAFFDDFAGAAATVRFDGGALESEFALNLGEMDGQLLGGDARVGDLVDSLPATTMLAVGSGIADGWTDEISDYLTSMGENPDELFGELEQETGLVFPDDLEALVGDGLAVAVDSGLDVESFFSASGPDEAELPLGVKVLGDSDDVEPVLDKLRGQLGGEGDLLASAAGDGTVAIGVDETYLEELAGDGGLGDEERFRDVLPEADRATSIAYADLDALVETVIETIESFDDALGGFGNEVDGISIDPAASAEEGSDAEVRENLEPLAALGAASWVEDGVVHGRFRLTTD